MTYGDLIRQQMMTDEGLVKVLSEFSIGCLSNLVVKVKYRSQRAVGRK